MIVTQKYLTTCIIKKKYSFLKSGPNNKQCYRIRGFLTEPKKVRCSLLNKKYEDKDLFYKNDKNNVLNRYKVDDIKNIYFYNLLNFNLVDVLHICKILLHMKSITLYKYNNNMSINIQQSIKEKEKKKIEIKKRKNVIWQNNSNYLINSLVLFFKKYLKRYKEEKDLFFKLASYQMEKKEKKKKKKKKTQINSDNYVLTIKNLIDENIENKSVEKKRKRNYFKKYIIRGILENMNICVKKRSYVNNMKDKFFLFEFRVDNIQFSLECLYKKVRGIYFLYRNIMYIKINEDYKIPIAVLNIISNINVYYKVMKNYILVNSFFIKYYFKYYLNKFFNLNKMFIQEKKKKRKEYMFKNIKDSIIYVKEIKKTTMNNHLCDDKKKEIITPPCYAKDIINGTKFYNILIKNNIKIKRVKIYFNGKLFVSFPICLTYNINNYQFYLNNIKYFNINNFTTNELFILKDIYLNNKAYFMNNAFCYLNNENIIMSNEMLNIDLDYILLFYILYFNDNQNLYIPRVCNPAWPFYSMINRNNLVLKKTTKIIKSVDKKESKNIKSRNILKRVIYKADQNFVNFVF
ncbi:hypothetical protein CYL21_4296 [Plasmodium falciparum NF54]|uniref:Uncharacterized protein n=3 Tax=Plasmodium falciparum TaxID=5833 RepID=C6KTC2_PLAF7|nr:conserved Plasmodium protein, unknown function [Plasmodium falciparum 3D7]EWC89600.1 hypothetical protein PFNF54_01601 [Plasmodium falciparum NF54]KOB86869.1 hypothetical protein PFDG_02690 [Plasmodium falciparum Dd2]KAF4327645.1 hypothetical protein CYL21_4296 [Plasmodium falciparum NF54]PKC42801.1 hypothetical protein CK202_5146 [Plasmodium falciparum NF54]CAG25099.1 conserved Plasmodium protein, unknown function [Plasmodium falciparum 3D7]|eukprot:XP_966269.1 conserved Plasmodium protein, unknown function [Plasmodium falciparum 3D7]